MNKYIFILFYLHSILVNAQCSILVKQLGKPTDTLFIMNYELSKTEDGYVSINDSTLKINSTVSSPDRMMIMIDRNLRWWTSVWIEPNVNYKEIQIDYNKHLVSNIIPCKWDSITDLTSKLDNQQKYKEELVIIKDYIHKNPESYLSLWFFTHTGALAIGNIEEKQKLFNALNISLSKYAEYRQVKAELIGRKYPKNGDIFKEFTLINSNDSLIKTDIIKNKWILLNFWSTSCIPCIKEIDSLISFNNAIDNSKALIISISLDNNQDSWKNSKHTKKMNWTSVWQTDGFYGELCLHYNVYSMPFFILFNNEKKIFFIKDGSDELENIKTVFKENKLLK